MTNLTTAPATGTVTAAPSVVFVATDLSPSADEAIRQGDRHARARNGRLVVCHVIPHSGHIGSVLWPSTSSQLTQVQTEQIPGAMDRVRERVAQVVGRAASEFETVVLVGSPHASIIEAAESRGAELVVVGAATPGLAGRVLGTVTELVVRYAHCTVLVARAPRGLRVLAATDLSSPSLPALTAAAAEARRRGVPMLAVHCVEASFPGASAELLDTIVRDAREQLIAATRGADDLLPEVVVEIGDPGAAIVAAASGAGADLVVVATRGRTGLRRILLGSVAERVVRDAACSVLVVRH